MKLFRKNLSSCSSAKESLWQFLLVSNMIGIESFLAVQFVCLIVNIRSLGVPLAYTSLPSFTAAVMSAMLIVGLSFINEKYATSRRGKALLLVVINLIQFLGATLVIIGNLIKLNYYDDYTKLNPPNPGIITLSNYSDISENVDSSVHQVLQNLTYTNLTPTVSPGNDGAEPDSLLPFPYYAGIVMFGFALMESGFDAGNCFLKTYVLACSSPDVHATVLVKSTFIASFGGLYVTLLGALGIGEWLPAASHHSVNAITTLFIAGFALVVAVITLAVSLIAGMCCCSNTRSYPEATDLSVAEQRSGDNTAEDEKKKLLPDDQFKDEGREHLSWSVSMKMASSVLDKPSSLLDSLKKKSTRPTHRHVEGKANQKVKAVFGFFKRNKFRICLCFGTLFACWATFSFNIYSVNFVGVAVNHGDPLAREDSEAYARYMEGERSGSTGLLLLYLAYMVTGSLQNTIMQRFGWWREASLVLSTYTVVTVCCAFFLKQWLYFLATSLTGFLRVVVFTVPYILVTKATKEDEDSQGKDTSRRKNTDIAMIAALWPSSFLIAGAVTGPLLSWTDNAATSVYSAGFATAIALVFFWFIRKR